MWVVCRCCSIRWTGVYCGLTDVSPANPVIYIACVFIGFICIVLTLMLWLVRVGPLMPHTVQAAVV